MAGATSLDVLAGALRELHRALMEQARRDYERERLAIVTPGELLRLLTTGEEFAWLRELSELMADLDVVRDAETEDTSELAGAIRPAVEHLLATPEAPQGGVFAQRYWPYVHADPHVAMAHAGVRQALNAWPSAGKSGDPSEHRRRLATHAQARASLRPKNPHR